MKIETETVSEPRYNIRITEATVRELEYFRKKIGDIEHPGDIINELWHNLGIMLSSIDHDGCWCLDG